MAKKNDININEWYKGIALSSYFGFADCRNVDVKSIPGVAMINYKAFPYYRPASVATTFTADAGTDVITVGTTFAYTSIESTVNGTGRPVVLTTTGTLPAGLSTSTTYFLIRTGDLTYKLATTFANAIAGTAIDITGAGSGTHTATTTNLGTIKQQAYDQKNSVRYFQDSNGRVWKFNGTGSTMQLINGNTLTSGTGNGLVVWKDYLFAFRSAKIDVYGPLSSSPTWSNDWQTITAGDHYAIVGQDNILYFCNGKNIGSLKEVTTFNPATGGTFTFNASALDLPENVISYTLEEFGQQIAIGTNNYKVYFWDRVSASFALPLRVSDKITYSMLYTNNMLFIAGGTSIYIANGSDIVRVSKIPEELSSLYNFNNQSAVGYIKNMIRWNDKVYFSLSSETGVGGVWSLDLASPDGNYPIVLESVNSDGSYGSSGSACGASLLFVESEELYWVATGGTSGIDVMENTRVWTNYEPYITTQWIELGTKIEPYTLSRIEVHTDKAMLASESIKVEYRTSNTTYSAIETFTGDGATEDFYKDIGHISDNKVQFKISFAGSNLTGRTRVRLREILVL